MYQCCGFDKLFSSLKAVRQHITNSVKTNAQSRTYTATDRAVRARPAGQPNLKASRRLPEPLAGGTATLQEIFDPERVPAPAVIDSYADELSLLDLSCRDKDSEDEPNDPGELQYCNIYCIQYPYILCKI